MKATCTHVRGFILATLILAGLSNISQASNIHYTGPAGGTWTDAANWGDNHYPGEEVHLNDTIYLRDSDDVVLSDVLAFPLYNAIMDYATAAPAGKWTVADGAVAAITTLTISKKALLEQAGGVLSATTINMTGWQLPPTNSISGGTQTVGTLNIAKASSNYGVVLLGGNGVLNVSTKLYLGGVNATASFIMSGGTVNLTGTASMDVAGTSSIASVLFHQSGGVFNNSSGGQILLTAASGGTAEFRLSGGVFNANGGMFKNDGSSLASQGLFTMSGGSLNMGGGELRVSRGNHDSAVGQVFDVTGGTITGVSQLWGGLNLQAGSVFVAGSSTNSASTTAIASAYRGELNLVAGTVVFPVFGDGSASQIDNSVAYQYGHLDLSGGTVAVQFDGAYTPMVGHSYDLLAGTTDNSDANTTLSTANIAGISHDGAWNITWDTSDWLANGVLTVQAVASLSAPRGTVVVIR